MGALRNMNKGAHEIARTAFQKLLLDGAFPKVNFVQSVSKYGSKSTSYSMIEYSTKWATFTKIAHNKLIAAGFEYGLWQNARNKKYLAEVAAVTAEITEEQVNGSDDRFRTMFG